MLFRSGLGWIRETTTPQQLTQPRERAESSSTHATHETEPEPYQEDDGIDQNPEQTDVLAEEFTEHSRLFGIDLAAFETPQDQTHYLPTHTGIRPPSINPIRV